MPRCNSPLPETLNTSVESVSSLLFSESYIEDNFGEELSFGKIFVNMISNSLITDILMLFITKLSNYVFNSFNSYYKFYAQTEKDAKRKALG